MTQQALRHLAQSLGSKNVDLEVQNALLKAQLDEVTRERDELRKASEGESTPTE